MVGGDDLMRVDKISWKNIVKAAFFLSLALYVILQPYGSVTVWIAIFASLNSALNCLALAFYWMVNYKQTDGGKDNERME